MNHDASTNIYGELLWATLTNRSTCSWQLRSCHRDFRFNIRFLDAESFAPDGQLLLCIYRKQQSDYVILNKLAIYGIAGPAHEDLLDFHFSNASKSQYSALRMLWCLYCTIQNDILREFFYQILSDRVFIAQFFPAKASHRHHHSHIGGLLEHSLEVARTAMALAKQYNMDPDTCYVAMLGGLLHDAGKIYQYYNQPTRRGICEQHEALTFMCLQPQLEFLRQKDPHAFEALCGCLTLHDKQASPYIPETLVRIADQLSAELAQRKQAFADLPDHFWFSKSENDQRIYKRLCR